MTAKQILESYLLGREINYFKVIRYTAGSLKLVNSIGYLVTKPALFANYRMNRKKSTITSIEIQNNSIKIILEDGVILTTDFDTELNFKKTNPK